MTDNRTTELLQGAGGGGRMSEYRPTEYVVDFGDCRSNRFVGLNMTLIKQNGAKLHERIVRCRDCVHAELEGEPPRKGCEGLLWCDYLTEGIGFSVLPHNFCAWAERKEVER